MGISFDAASWSPSQADPEPAGIRALIIPDVADQPVVELYLPEGGDACYNAVRDIIQNILQHLPVLDGVDFLCDQEGVNTGRPLNVRATKLAHGLKRRLAAGTYPGLDTYDGADEDAAAWEKYVRIVGPAVVVGEHHGDWVSLPESAIVVAESIIGPFPRP